MMQSDHANLNFEDALLYLAILSESQNPYVRSDIIRNIYPALKEAAKNGTRPISYRPIVEMSALITKLTGNPHWLVPDSTLWEPEFANQLLGYFYDGRFFLDREDLQIAQQADQAKKQTLTLEKAKEILLMWDNPSPRMDSLGKAISTNNWRCFDLVNGSKDFLYDVGTYFPPEQRAYFQHDSPIWQEPLRSELCKCFVCVTKLYSCTGPQYEFYASPEEAAIHRNAVPQPGEFPNPFYPNKIVMDQKKEQLRKHIEFFYEHPQAQKPAGIVQRLEKRLYYLEHGYPNLTSWP